MAEQWLDAGEVDALEVGQMRCFELGGRRVLLARVDDTTTLAADEMCTHEDASLCLGALAGTRVKCPLHGSWFDLRDGTVHDEPADTPLAVHPVRVSEGRIYVRLETPSEASD